jgi:hypothetical protein
MSILSVYNSLNADKWFSFTDTPPVSGGGTVSSNQSAYGVSLTTRCSTGAGAPTLMTDGSGPDGGNYWRFNGYSSGTTASAVTLSANATWQSYVQDNDYVIGVWVRLNRLSDLNSVTPFTLMSLDTFSSGGFRLRVAGETGVAATKYRIHVQTASTVTGIADAPLFAGQWYFIAIKRVNTTYTLYINGVSSATWTGNTGSPTNIIWGATSHTETSVNSKFDLAWYIQGPTNVMTDAVLQTITAEMTYGKYARKLWEIDKTPNKYHNFNFTNSNGFQAGHNYSTLSMSGVKGSTAWDQGTGTNARVGQGSLFCGSAYQAHGALDMSVALTGATTIAFWMKKSSIPAFGDNRTLAYWYSNSTVNIDGSSELGIRFDNGYLEWGPQGGSVSPTPINSGKNMCDNAWHHVVAVNANNGNKLYIDGSLVGTWNAGQSYGLSGTANFTIGSMNSTYLDEFSIHNKELTAAEVTALYAAAQDAVDLTYTNTTGATASATFPEPAWSAESVVNLTYNSDVLGTASAESVMPALETNANLDAFGVAEATAEFVSATPAVDKNNEYAADPATSSAEMTEATISTQIYVDYSASPATASALFAANIHAGMAVLDSSYSVSMRQINETTNTDGKNGFDIGSTWTNSNLDSRTSLAFKANSGVPTNGSLIKVKLNPSHVTAVTTNDTNGANTYNIYVFTENPSTSFTTMTYANLPAKELLYTTRSDDSDAQYLDLTRAFVDNRGSTYGIFVEHVGTPPYSGTVYDRTTYSGNNLEDKVFYILTSEYTNVNYNVPAATASAEMTTATIEAQDYVNVSADPSTVSAEIVNPSVQTTAGATVLAAEMTVNLTFVQPAFIADTSIIPDHLEAFVDMMGFIVSAIKNVNYQVDATTVNALLHMPQAQIGENNSVDHMNASALFVMPIVIIPDTNAVDAMTATAFTPNATVTTQLNAPNIIEPMKASALSPNPPAYADPQSDPWFQTLYAQHSVRHGLSAGLGYSFLKLFDDQNTDITQATPNTVQSTNVFNGLPTLRQLRNNLTWGMAINSGPENDIRKPVAPAITDYSTPTNESRMSVGYFDNWNRKAVRLQNIAFKVKDDYSYARHMFSWEFSIKTTKADQIIGYGEFASLESSGKGKTTFNLVDGKLNFLSYAAYDLLHPKSVKPSNWSLIYRDTVTGNKQINDGNWHHIVIQGNPNIEADDGIQGRFQIWIDGELDIQRFERFMWDPDYMGANLENAAYAPDFYTSAWSVDTEMIVAERDIDLHYFDFIKFEPYKADPMTATITATQGNEGRGNRGRALMLYWWPTNPAQNKNLITRGFNTPYQSTGINEFDRDTFDIELDTWDYTNRPPQQYYGWDVYPVDITGYYVSDLVKESAYGGAENIVETYNQPLTSNSLKWKVNRRGYFRNTLDDTRRYLDVKNDIDLSQFDAIFFRNYPDQTNELDFYARNEVVDPYFNIRETKIYEDFVKSVREAVDTGISLMITNPQLALDLKIINRIEVVPDLDDTTGYESDPYSPTIVPGNSASLAISTGNTANVWEDTYKNNRFRVLNTLERLTDWRTVIRTDMAYWSNDDTLNFGGPDQPFYGYQYKANGLNIGDEFIESTFYPKSEKNYLAVPADNILAGLPITAFANTYRKGLEVVQNPYRNHVTSIAVLPGTVLDGKQVGGKIFVNFTERISEENEYVTIDGIHTDWINYAYAEGGITQTTRDVLLAQPDLLETQLAQGRITQNEYNVLSKWQSNGSYILTQTDTIEVDVKKSDFSGGSEKFQTRKFNKQGIPSTQNTYFSTTQFFTFKYARKYIQLVFEAQSMNTRGFLWLSDRESEVGLVNRPLAIEASATMPGGTAVVQKFTTINTQAMLANATKVAAVGFAGGDSKNLAFPLTAQALITQPVRLILAAPMNAAASFREQSITRTTATDQVVVYILHEDPILYLREDIIK